MLEPGWPTAGWPRDEPWAEVAETHAAAVYLAGGRAYKVKKPVNLGFLDFSTVAARAAACAREVELNREFVRVAQDDTQAAFEARHLAEVALRHLRAGAVTLVLVGGLPGTGKSALADAVAGHLGFTVLNSDWIRKELAGLPAEASARAPYGSGIYTAGWTEHTYASCCTAPPSCSPGASP
jgi:hypothetical protein